MGQVLVYIEGLPVRCGVCSLNKWWGGKKPRVQMCGCTPEPAVKPAFGSVRQKARPATAKTGRRGERNAARLMTGAGLLTQLTAGSGATASRSCERAFDTDMVSRLGDSWFKVESKAMTKVPGLTSFRALLSGSDMLRVEQDGEGFWFFSDAVMAEIGGLAAEAVEGRATPKRWEGA